MSKFVVGDLDLTLRRLLTDDLDMVADLTVGHGWSMTHADLQHMHRTDTEAFMALFLDGRLVCHIAVVRHSLCVAYIGLFIADPSYRGKGIGTKLLQNILHKYNEFTLVLDSVPGKLDYYHQFGFKLAGAEKRKIIGRTNEKAGRYYDETSKITGVTKMTQDDLEDIRTYDKQTTGMDRASLIRNWALADDSSSFSCRSSDGRICGYVTMRPALQENHYKICGLYSNTPDIAKHLLSKALSTVPCKSSVSFSVPSVNFEVCREMLPTFLDDVSMATR